MTRSKNGVLRATYVWLCLLVLGVGLSACATSPRHRDRIANRGTAIKFSGFTLFPNEPISIVASCQGTPVTVGGAVSDTEVTITDTAGIPWYQYNTTVVIAPNLWCQTNAPPTSPQRFFTRVGTRGPKSGQLGIFASREHGAETNDIALEDCATGEMTGAEIRVLCALQVPDNLALIFAGQ